MHESIVRTFPIELDTFYRLSFEAKSGTAGVRWFVHMRNAEGALPFDGCLEGDWQQLDPGRQSYTHSFLSATSGSVLQFGFRHAGGAPAAENVRLERIEPPHAVLNGDFSAGPHDESGWNERYNTDWLNDDGQMSLRVNRNGYALTDYFPVRGGGGYTYVRGAKAWPGVTALAYDAHKRLLAYVARDHRRTPPLEMPVDAVYARILFHTDHDHIPSFTTNLITHTGLVPVGELPAPLERPRPPSAADEIVLHPDCDPREEHAARELLHWVLAITGKKMPLLARPSDTENVKIHVGGAWAGAFEDDLRALEGSDGYAVRRRGQNIYVFGAHPRGALYGAYALLEQNSDILWPRPQPDFEAIFTPMDAMRFDQADFISRPVFDFREISRGGYGMLGPIAHEYQDWAGRNGLNTPMRLHRGFNYLLWQRGAQPGYGSGFMSWLGINHDERLLPLVDGQRLKSIWVQPCFTYPGTVETLVRAISRELESLPGKKLEYVISRLGDNWSVCACEDCLQPIALPDGSKLEPRSPYSNQDSVFFSTRHFIMLNQVAEALVADYPDLQLHTHAYIFTAEPPKVPVHPAIIPHFAAYPTQNARFPILAGKGAAIGSYETDTWKRRFRAWGEWKPDGMGFFGYYYTPGFNALADTAAADYRALARFGGVHVHTEGFPVDGDELSTWDVDGVEKWIMARLMWNPEQDPAALRERYIARVYREAAPEMRQFYRLIHDAWHDPDNDLFVNCHSLQGHVFEGLIVKTGLEEPARALLAKAVSAAKHPLSKQMIQRTLDHFDTLADSLGRHVVPHVDESTQEWNDPVSMHWEKAVRLEGFKKVDDWRQHERTDAAHQTTIDIMHDDTMLYFKVVAFDNAPEQVVTPSFSETERFPNGDRVEILLLVNGRTRYLVAVGPNGNRWIHPALAADWQAHAVTAAQSWTAMAALPLAALGLEDDEATLAARFGRVYRSRGEEREESTLSGASLFNTHESFWLPLNIEAKGR